MKIGNTSNSLGFASKINILKKYDEFLDKVIESDDCVLVHEDNIEAEPIKYSNEMIATFGIGPCTAFGVVRPKEICALYHYIFYPTEINNCLGSLKADDKKGVRGFIMGGQVPGLSRFFKNGVKSYKDIPTTVLWGKPSNIIGKSPSVCYDVIKDTWQVLPAFNGPVKTAEDLKKAFKFIHIAKGDELYIDGKQIDTIDVNQNIEEFVEPGL